MKKKLNNILLVLPVFILGGVGGYSLSILADFYQPSMWDFSIIGGVVGVALIVSIVWIFQVTE